MSVDKIKEEKKNFKERIALRDALNRLSKNKDFKLVIEQTFMEKECARYARLSGLQSVTADVRADSLAKCQAAGHLQEFFHMVEMLGNRAEQSLRDLLDAETEINAEALRGEE